MDNQRDIVIVGAGVIGLSTAWILSELGLGTRIIIVAKHTPGDLSIEYTSPWAGANFSCISSSNPSALRWDEITYNRLVYLANTQKQSSVTLAPTREYWEHAQTETKIQSLGKYMKDFKLIPLEELPEGCKFGYTGTTILLNAPHYIQYIYDIVIKAGVHVVKRELKHISEALEVTPSKPSVVFNCTGIGAYRLPGVEDHNVYPTRGQVVCVDAPHIKETRSLDTDTSITYIIPRPMDGGVILGGYLQRGNWDAEAKPEETQSILERAYALMPELTHGEGVKAFKIRSVGVGLRPSRKGGARVELDVVPGSSVPLVHNYGASGTGYQAGYGMSLDAVMLVLPKLIVRQS
ncbi:D-amino acid oxidase [Schizosaccharomyces japonicus yFS275]|uniref:D-amino acid oxidase n=1 Tax=Schizosaccharomyces japonicus (strain yFS275 / FY16936) TaxID=402676 RepID=B6K2M9_SCHJY|nr:D-amino acid oxidase [Schizosaccharomyces japonicus yFS275]EEB07410.1 D-amino acid oxidase [Schizosaccharomyces japonicus yFS275]